MERFAQARLELSLGEERKAFERLDKLAKASPARKLSEADVRAALKTYTPSGRKDEYPQRSGYDDPTRRM